MPQIFIKDPDATKDYQINWNTWLNGDTISTSEWDVPDGIKKENDTNNTTTATIWVSGGTAGEMYKLVNTIVTAGGRTEQDSITIKVLEK